MGHLVGATALAAVVGVVAYSARVRDRSGCWSATRSCGGSRYVLVWEGVVATFGSFAAKLAIRGYTRSIITARTHVDLELGDLSLTVGIVVPLVVAVVALLVGELAAAIDGRRLSTRSRRRSAPAGVVAAAVAGHRQRGRPLATLAAGGGGEDQRDPGRARRWRPMPSTTGSVRIARRGTMWVHVPLSIAVKKWTGIR